MCSIAYNCLQVQNFAIMAKTAEISNVKISHLKVDLQYYGPTAKHYKIILVTTSQQNDIKECICLAVQVEWQWYLINAKFDCDMQYLTIV